MEKSIVITGAAGFIGSNAVRSFAEAGYRVYGFDNLSRSGTELNLDWLNREYASQFTFLPGDVKNEREVYDALRKAEPDAILHLAGQVAVTTSISDPRSDFETNALGTLNLLEATRELAPKARLIFASTNKVYGALSNLDIRLLGGRYWLNSGKGISESQPLDFYSPYGCSKGAADQYVRDYKRIYKLDTVVLRQSCVYGQRQFGVEDQGWVAWFALRALAGLGVTVFGSGNQVRDLLNVSDLVSLYRVIFDSESVPSDIYNVGGGDQNTLSINELLKILEEKFGLLSPVDYSEERQGDQKFFVSNNEKLEQDFGWQPRVNLEEGLPDLLEWLRHVPQEFKQ